MEKLSKKALGCMYAAAIIAALIETAAVVIANVLWIIPLDVNVGKIVSVVVLILIVLQATVLPYFRFHRYSYKIDEDFIDVREGYIFVERNIVPFDCAIYLLQPVRIITMGAITVMGWLQTAFPESNLVLNGYVPTPILMVI